jgi:ATP-dependent Zn protease
MGRHVWFRTPTMKDRIDILDLYIGKVKHDPQLDTAERRDEIARITGGYSPAMIEQVTSMALTIAHHSGREGFIWEDLVESITTLESGTAVGVEYVPAESRATAIHEAGHALAGHAYQKDHESTRLSIRMRGSSHGHYMNRAKEERFGHFQSELFADLVVTLGAMAAERVFYGENTNGVGGDVHSVTGLAALMAGQWSMGPRPFVVQPKDGETDEQARRRVLDRFERIGLQIMNRTSTGSMMNENPIAGVLGDPSKRAAAAQLLGQAYVAAHNLIQSNQNAVESIAEELITKKEIFGNELQRLLERQKIDVPEIDFNDEASWPAAFFETPAPRPPAAALPAPEGAR